MAPNVPDIKYVDVHAKSMLELLDAPPRTNPFWLSHIIPKSGIVLIGGASKTGKSWFINNMCRSLTLGVDFLPPEPGYAGGTPSANSTWSTPSPQSGEVKVLLFDRELGEDTIRNRINSIFAADLAADKDGTRDKIGRNFFVFSKNSGKDPKHQTTFATREGRDLIYQMCQEVQPQVVFLEPIGEMHHYDENSASDIQRLKDDIEKIKAMLAPLETSVVITHHFGKPARSFQGNGPQIDPLDPYNFRGSSKWFDIPDNLITMMRRPSGSNPRCWELEMKIKPRHEEELPRVLLGVNQLMDGRIYFRRIIGPS